MRITHKRPRSTTVSAHRFAECSAELAQHYTKKKPQSNDEKRLFLSFIINRAILCNTLTNFVEVCALCCVHCSHIVLVFAMRCAEMTKAEALLNLAKTYCSENWDEVKDMEPFIAVHTQMASNFVSLGNFHKAQDSASQAHFLCTQVRFSLRIGTLLAARFNSIQLYGEHHAETVLASAKLGIVERQRGNYEIANDLLNQSIASMEALYGPWHIQLGQLLSEYGILCYFQQRYDEALSVLERALVIFQREFGNSHNEVATVMSNMGGVLLRLDRVAEAEPLLRTAVAVSEAHSQHVRTWGHLQFLLEACERQRKWNDALDVAKQMADIEHAQKFPSHLTRKTQEKIVQLAAAVRQDSKK